MADSHRVSQARGIYLAFAAGDRDVIERGITDDFTFSSPVDVGLDREGYFERCWPAAGRCLNQRHGEGGTSRGPALRRPLGCSGSPMTESARRPAGTRGLSRLSALAQCPPRLSSAGAS